MDALKTSVAMRWGDVCSKNAKQSTIGLGFLSITFTYIEREFSALTYYVLRIDSIMTNLEGFRDDNLCGFFFFFNFVFFYSC